MSIEKEANDILEDCPELFRAAVTVYIKKIKAICDKHEVAGECYDRCPLYGKVCGLTRSGTEVEINEVIDIVENYDIDEDCFEVCKCGYIFDNDSGYKYCPYCGGKRV